MISNDDILILTPDRYMDIFLTKFKHVHKLTKSNMTKKLVSEILQYSINHNIKYIIITWHCRKIPLFVTQINKLKQKVKLIIMHQKHYFRSSLVPFIDAILEYSPKSSEKFYSPKYFNIKYRHRYHKIPCPLFINKDQQQQLLEKSKSYDGQPYLFTGGQNQRNFSILIKSMKNIPIKLYIVSRDTVNTKNIPSNVIFKYRLPINEFRQLMANSLAVILPINPHAKTVVGQTMISEALFLGKPIISLKNPSVVENLGKESILCDNSITSYRHAIKTILDNKQREKLTYYAKKRGDNITFESYVGNLKNICNKL